MFFILHGELDAYVMKSEFDSKQYKRQLQKEFTTQSSINKSPLNRSRSPARSIAKFIAPPVIKELSQISLITDEDFNVISRGEAFSPVEENDKSGSHKDTGTAQISLLSKIRKNRSRQTSIMPIKNIGIVDVTELPFYSNLEALRGDNEMLWDGCYHLNYLNTLKSGEVFGEMALTTGKRQPATVIAVEDCALGVLYREDFNRICQAIETKVLEAVLDFFAKAIGVRLSRDAMLRLSKIFMEEKMMYRQNLFLEGDPAEGFYIVKSGEVLVKLSNRNFKTE